MPVGYGFPTGVTNLTDSPLTGTTAQFNTALSDNNFTTLAGTETLTNKTINGASNTITGITEAALNASIVSQSKLKSTTGSVSTASTTEVNFVLPGGEYGFYPGLRMDTQAGAQTARIMASQTGLLTTSYQAIIALSTSLNTVLAQQRYIQASPPYDLGDGQIEQFVFVLVNAAGRVISTYAAPEAPWHNNGPTDIRADRYSADGRGYRWIKQFFVEHGSVKAALAKGLSRDRIADLIQNSPLVEVEITQAIKNADMNLIPHPFGTVPPGHTVVLLDPVSPLMGKLACLGEGGESICELLHSGDLVVTNTEVIRIRPRGVLTTACRFR